MSRLKQIFDHPLLRTAGVYFVANVFNAALPFALLPVLTRYLTPTDYGIVAMFSVMVGMAMPITGLNVHGGVARQYYRRDEIDFPQYVSSAIATASVSFVIFGLLIALLAQPLSTVTDFPASWMWSVPVFTFAHVLFNLRLLGWQLERRPYPYAALQIGLTAVEIGLALTLIVGLGMDWEGRIVSRLAAIIGFAVISVLFLARGGWLKLSVSREHVEHLLRFGVPLIPHTLGLWVMSLSDRLFITELVGIDETGLYAVGAQISMAIVLVSAGFTAAWTPWLFERLKADTDADRHKAVRVLWLYCLALGAVGAAVALLGPPSLVWLVGPKFADASAYIPPLVAGMVLLGFYQAFSGFLFYAEQTTLLAKITGFTAVLNLVLNYVLIKAHGGIGAAEATLLAYAAYFVITLLAARRVFPMRWSPFGA